MSEDSWNEMLDTCKNKGGDLAAIHNAADNLAASQLCLDASEPGKISLCFIGAEGEIWDDYSYYYYYYWDDYSYNYNDNYYSYAYCSSGENTCTGAYVHASDSCE